MKSSKTLDQLDGRFTEIVNELSALGKEYTQKEMNLKVLRSLPKEWYIKVVAMRESKELTKLTIQELFSDFKAFEFEMNRRETEEASSSKGVAFTATEEKASEEGIEKQEEDLALLVRKFKRFMRKNYVKPENSPRKSYKKEEMRDDKTSDLCYNCHKPGHFQYDCPEDSSRKGSEDRKERREKRRIERRKAMMVEADQRKHERSEESISLEDDDDSSSEEEALICLMAKEEEVTSELSSSDSDTDHTPINLYDSLKKLMRDFDNINAAHSKLKDENSSSRVRSSS